MKDGEIVITVMITMMRSNAVYYYNGSSNRGTGTGGRRPGPGISKLGDRDMGNCHGCDRSGDPPKPRSWLSEPPPEEGTPTLEKRRARGHGHWLPDRVRTNVVSYTRATTPLHVAI